MRILVVSDLHGNTAAIEAVREKYDVCLCLGDLVEYGPDPGPCLEWVRQNATYTVRGNHDHGAAQGVDIEGFSGFRYLTMTTRQTTAAQLTSRDRRFLADLPTSKMLTLGGKRFLIVHASPRDPMDEYVPPDPAAWAARLHGIDVDYVCAGHTHIPYVIKVGKTTIINPGSVGLQRDGDPRARYAVIDNDQIELNAIEYDVERTIAEVMHGPLEQKAKNLLSDVYRIGKYVPINGTNGHH